MAVIAILIGIALPSFRGIQSEARITRVQRDLRTLKIAVESYYKNHAQYPNAEFPPPGVYQDALLNASPQILEKNLYDPFGGTSTTQYVYNISTSDPATAKYYVIYSVGSNSSGTASVDNNGTVTASNGAIWVSNGY